ncbi:CMP-N-acetylneuraminate-beta-galactosamide-alpha-2,3-sialyltransferase 4 [Merluccius polli]|uniref:CMP-N-acetylneuraminate-beta-galactosamide-alpha-2,3-sialyltransferase 4 n=1 Tax=Merluccius polli TaxID=89951 RepID=A0AA47P813_MERPO|nr:CMP-N-acetylneuraminate-beta-galactosamide-alpha-2,3-sialyltransferase 4 [Merluccius polli]
MSCLNSEQPAEGGEMLPDLAMVYSDEDSLEHVKMFQMSTKTLWLWLLLVFLLLTYYKGTNKSSNSSMLPCGGLLTQHKWERLNLNISRQTHLFLEMKDFFWHKHLSNQTLPYGIKGNELLLLKIISKVQINYVPDNIENLRCRTCVVVGNGFSIKNTSLGSAIDKHHVVIRLNDSPVRGYEEDVGGKTTMRLFYPESATYNPNLQNNPDTLMVLVPFKQEDLHWLKAIVYKEKIVSKGFWKHPPLKWLGDISKIRVLDPHYLHQTADRLLHIPLHSNNRKPVHPTTGILAVFVALNYCDVVHIAGFGYPSSKNQNHRIHYFGYDTIKSMKNSYHDVQHEADALKRLEDLGAIVFLHPHT